MTLRKQKDYFTCACPLESGRRFKERLVLDCGAAVTAA